MAGVRRGGGRRRVLGVVCLALVIGVGGLPAVPLSVGSATVASAEGAGAAWVGRVPEGEPVPTGTPPDGAIPAQDWRAPEEGVATVVLDGEGKPVPADELAVAVASASADAEGLALEVTVEDQGVAGRLGVSGFVFTLEEVTDTGVSPVPEGSAEEEATSSTTSTTTSTVPSEEAEGDAEPVGGPVPGDEPTSTAVPVESDGESSEPIDAVDKGVPQIEVTVSYSDLKGRFGGGFVDRLRLVRFPSCVLESPIPAGCDVVGTPVESLNDRERDVLVAVMPVPSDEFPVDEADAPSPSPTDPTSTSTSTTTTTDPSTTTTTVPVEDQAEVQGLSAAEATRFGGGGGGGGVFALTSGGSGQQGDFGATPLPLKGEWDVGVGSGAFSWSYPVPIQPGPAGDVPSLSLDYSSASIDGMVGGRNNQGGDIGLGWGYTQGYIERRYIGCSQDGGSIADLCWKSQNATLVLNGVATELVFVSGNLWRAKNDPNWKIERVTGASNGDNDGEYWRVFTPDGTKYVFGLGATVEGAVATNSAWTVPVYGNQSGEPCYSGGAAWCQQAWRWNLDRIEDPHLNVTSLFYERDTNKYGVGGSPSNAQTYTAGGRLAKIEYGHRRNATTPARGKVVLESEYRCTSLSSACPAPTGANGTQFPDLPNDLICTGSTCSGLYSPSFFSKKRITRISSQVYVGTSYTEVDALGLTHEWMNNGEDEDADGVLDSYLFLRYINPVGFTETTPIGLPKVYMSTGTAYLLPNRANAGGSILPLKKHRIGAIYTSTGSRVNVTYDQPHPCTQIPPAGDWDDNFQDCFPKHWVPSFGPAGFGTFNKYLVTSVTETDLVGGSPTMVTEYDYQDAPAWHHDDDPITPAGQQSWSDWRGHSTVVVTRGTGADAAHIAFRTKYRLFRGMNGDKLVGGGTRSVAIAPLDGTTAVLDDNWLQGRVFDEVELTSLGVIKSGNKHYYETRITAGSGAGAARWVAENQNVTRLDDGGGAYRKTRNTTTYNTNRLPTTVLQEGWLDETGDERCLETLYASNTTTYLIDYPKQSRIRATTCTGTNQQETRFSYDLAAWGTAPTVGNVTKTSVWTSTTYWSDTTTLYDSLGRVISVDDPNAGANETTTTYSPAANSTFAPWPTTTTVTDDHGNTTVTDWEPYRRNLPEWIQDTRGKKTSFGYDALGRLRRVWKPMDPTSGPATVEYQYVLTQDPVGYGAGSEPVVTTLALQTASPLVQLVSAQIYDGFGRARQAQSVSPTAGKLIVSTTRYTSAGMVDSELPPQALTGGPTVGTRLGYTPANTLAYTYDSIGREATRQYLTGTTVEWTTATTRTAAATTVNPEVGGDTRTTTDGLGRVTEVAEHDGAWNAAKYTYNPAGNLTTITDPALNVITYGYDNAGRRTSMTDPDAGPWTYTYDPNGNQTTATAVGTTPTPTLWTGYDTLNRPTQRRKTNSTGTLLAEWTYYTTGPNQGLPQASIRHHTGTLPGQYKNEVTAYNDNGQPTARTITAGDVATNGALAGPWDFTYAYNSAGNQTSVTYPVIAGSGLPEETVATTYSNLGAPQRLNGTSPYVSNTDWDDRGRTLNRVLGGDADPNRVTRTYAYDAQQRLTTWTATRGATTLQSDQITLDDIGNVTARKDNLVNQFECYKYDNRNRLTTAFTSTAATCPASAPTGAGAAPDPYNHAYTYSSDGRFLSRTENNGTPTTHTYTYESDGSTRPHAVTDITGLTSDCNPAAATDNYCYDANGNLTGRPGTTGTNQTLAWDPEHRLTTVTEGANVTSFVYDPDGTRLIRKTPTNTTLYIEGHELTLTGTTLTTKRYYTLAGVTVAMRDSATGALSYLLGDQLGSTTVSVNASGGTPVVQRYLPYGAPRSVSGGSAVTDRGWIGQTKDTSTGLQYLNARYYDPAIGRFTVPDPMANLDAVGSLDRYGYGLGSPATLSDPSGLYVPVDAVRTNRAWDARRANFGFGGPARGARRSGLGPKPAKLQAFIQHRDDVAYERKRVEQIAEAVEKGYSFIGLDGVQSGGPPEVEPADPYEGCRGGANPAYQLTCTVGNRTPGDGAASASARPAAAPAEVPFGGPFALSLDTAYDGVLTADALNDLAKFAQKGKAFGGGVYLLDVALRIAFWEAPSGRHSQGGACTPEAQETMGFSAC